MKTPEDEAFDDIERRQGGFQAKRQMAADKMREPVVQPAPGYCKNCKDYTIEEPLYAQPAQEPVCPACKAEVLYECVACSNNNYPPQHKWVDLTDDEIAQGNKESWVTKQAWESAVWWASEKLKEKNNG